MSDNQSNNNNRNPIVIRNDEVRRDMAPIQKPADLLGEALRRISPQKQEQIVGKVAEEVARIEVKREEGHVAEEVARIEVKREEGHVDQEVAAGKVGTTAQAANRLASAGHEFEVKAEHHSEHGFMQVSVRNKPASLREKIGCFVATACYGDESRPAVVVLRRFRDECLQPTSAGRSLISWYYRTGPAFAQFIEDRLIFRLAGRLLLWPLVAVALGTIWLRRKIARISLGVSPRPVRQSEPARQGLTLGVCDRRP